MVLVGLAKLDDFVGAEFSYFVALEDVVLADPVQLGCGVVADFTDLRTTKKFGFYKILLLLFSNNFC